MRPRAFLRTTEFLWQEGHTAHATEKEAREETLRMLEVYTDFAVNETAIPVIPGKKTEREKFAGAVDSFTIEAMMGNGWALQSGTTHYLGTNFARAFDTKFLDENNEQQYVHQTSWGVSTRLIGGVIMAHGDADGLRLPPRIAPVQVVIVPISKEDSRSRVMEACSAIGDGLRKRGVRVELDDRDGLSPGFKFNHWEVRGVPVRLEVGPRDLDSDQVVVSPRNRPGSEGKSSLGLLDLDDSVPRLLERIQAEMLQEATERRDARMYTVDSYEEFLEAFPSSPGFYTVWWDGGSEEEERLQAETMATVRCIPSDQPGGRGRCFMTGRDTGTKAIIARAY
jgi:prolyl-tRNA synthetase